MDIKDWFNCYVMARLFAGLAALSVLDMVCSLAWFPVLFIGTGYGASAKLRFK